MTSHEFAYWLNGFVELNGGAQPTAAQWKMITEHLGTVFKKVTPPLELPIPDERRTWNIDPGFGVPHDPFHQYTLTDANKLPSIQPLPYIGDVPGKHTTFC